MALYNDYGIIFKIKDFGEADKLVSIIGQKNGRIDSIGKGARKPTSKKTASIDLFNEGKFSFANGKNLDIIVEVELKNSHSKIKESLSTSKYLFYFAELVDLFFPEKSQGSEIFEVITDLIETLSIENKEAVCAAFELKILNIGGFGPNLETCDLCSVPLKENVERVAHAGSGIGFICAKHMRSEDYTSIDDRIIKIAKLLLEGKFEDAEKIKFKKNELEKLRKLNKLWIQSIIGKEIKSYKFLEKYP